MNGATAFLADELAAIAGLLKCDPVQFFGDYLAAGNDGKAPTPKGGGQYAVVPPEGFEPPTSGTNVRRFPVERTRPTSDRDVAARVTAITGRSAS